MHSRGVIFSTPRYIRKINFLVKNLSYISTKHEYIKYSNNNNNITNTRSFYTSKNVNTLNKWYTAGLKSAMTEKEAYEFVCDMNDDQRLSITKAMSLWESQKVKGQFEGQLAASVWRSRFGRPAKLLLPALGDVDASGQYCAVPDDWLKKKFAETTPEPTSNDLWKLGISNALPFIGFGFLDNFTMIIAGDYIEHTLGLYMCISTMAAAALGNTISDVLGIGSAYYVERLAESVGVKPPKLTPIQLEMKSSRRTANFGRVIGITIGCLVGMCPLMFMKDKESDKKKELEKKPIV